MADLRTVEQRVRDLAERYTYKPGTGFRIVVEVKTPLDHFGRSVGGPECWVTIIQMVLDSEHPDRPPTEVFTPWVVPVAIINRMSDEEIVLGFHDVVHRQESHEVDEWGRFDGKVIIEPHPESMHRLWSRRDAFAPPPEECRGISPLLETEDEIDLIPLQKDWRR